ncbi:hydroxymethylbilane synthase [Aequorivita echinoideorum]|uniref:Hydroxymethylbilane synthase n=1 Tax=Aequorivita echinoideorum TaxID=1549647 RepID=A0ABS5S3W5_9FLAO|nr:hydroxymethylbilane synthase [Aequorivita echinoideorum]MBT0607884.1 hydroxymethylbilane synthase [Aequorivita echinoideorum]
MKKVIRIGTRDSELALWQANTVKSRLEALGYTTQLVPVKSTGDLILDKPLYEMGITGIFTKTLDVAMLNGTVDIAVHSMKDVPTQLPLGIVQTAVLEREATEDILVTKGTVDFESPCTIATGSLRRKAQWLHRYPHHTVVDLRGNVNTRLQKLNDNNWQGAIFAKAGLERLGFVDGKRIKSPSFGGVGEDLDWMLPAAAQGAMVVVALEKDEFSREATAQLNHPESELATFLERDFLRTLEGGCTAPIGASAEIMDSEIRFKGCLFSLDGKTKIELEKNSAITEEQLKTSHFKDNLRLGRDCALEILGNGGAELMASIKEKLV